MCRNKMLYGGDLHARLLDGRAAVALALRDTGIETDGLVYVGGEEGRELLELRQRQILERAVFLRAEIDKLSGNFVGVPEGHAFFG